MLIFRPLAYSGRCGHFRSQFHSGGTRRGLVVRRVNLNASGIRETIMPHSLFAAGRKMLVY